MDISLTIIKDYYSLCCAEVVISQAWEKLSLKTAKLMINFVSKGVAWGLILGVGISIAFIFLLVLIFSISEFGALIFYGIFIGILSGVLLGGVNGLILAIVTMLFFMAKNSPIEYARVMLICSLIVTGIAAFVVFNYLLAGMTILIVTVTLTAVIGAGYASQEISTWYLKQ